MPPFAQGDHVLCVDDSNLQVQLAHPSACRAIPERGKVYTVRWCGRYGSKVRVPKDWWFVSFYEIRNPVVIVRGETCELGWLYKRFRLLEKSRLAALRAHLIEERVPGPVADELV